MASLVLRPLLDSDWESVSEIYAEGIKTGMATFETEVPNWERWDKKHISSCRLVAELNGNTVGFAVLSKASNRKVYEGVAEVSVYVSEKHRGIRIGTTLLNQLVVDSEINGFWTLQAGIFSKNTASINLHVQCGFRVIGIREKIGKMNNEWHDNHFLERRSKKI